VTFSRIIGTGGYLPEQVLTNQALERMVDTNDAWIVERTGIRARHIAADGQTTCDLAAEAAHRALDMAGIPATALDLMIVATTTPDRIFPSTACLLQQRLGNPGCPAFDVQAVCTGFVYALSIADSFIQAGKANTALVIGAETFSRLVDWTDRNTCVLFGDGAGAAVLRADTAPGIHSTHLHADGNYHEHLTAPGWVAGGAIQGTSPFCAMRGKEVFKFAVNSLAETARQALEHNHLPLAALDWLVPHQANIRIIQAVGDKLALPAEKVVVTVERHGNTSAASVPLALDEAVRDGRIQSGHKVLLAAMGGGFTWGSALLTF